MRAEELLKTGDLDGALQELQAEIRKRASTRSFVSSCSSFVRGD